LTKTVETVEPDASGQDDSNSSESHYATEDVAARSNPRWKTAIKIVGWVLVVTGAIVLEFAAFLIWGTGAQTAREQARLRREFDALSSSSSSAQSGMGRAAPVEMHPELGQPLARLQIPSLDLDAVVVEGVGHDELKLGPGHIPETALPGRVGNSVLSGHRTTYGAPFGNLDRLEPGAVIIVSTVEGESRYVVTRSYVVLPEDTSVTAPLKPTERPRLRLTTCHPRFSAAKRLVVEADLVSTPTR
jgi:sortase A